MCGNGCVYIDEETIIHCYRQIQIASPLTDRFFVGLEKQHMSKSFISIPNSKHRQQSLFNIWAFFSWNKLNVIHVSEHSFFSLQGRWQWGSAVWNWLTFKTRKVWISTRLTFNLRPLPSTLHLSIFITLSSFQNLPSFRLHLYPACSCAFFGLDGPGGTYCMLSGRLLVHPGRKWRVGVGRTGNGMGVDSLLTHFSPEELHLGDRCQVISDTSFPLYTRTLSDRHKQGRTQLQLIAEV